MNKKFFLVHDVCVCRGQADGQSWLERFFLSGFWQKRRDDDDVRYQGSVHIYTKLWHNGQFKHPHAYIAYTKSIKLKQKASHHQTSSVSAGSSSVAMIVFLFFFSWIFCSNLISYDQYHNPHHQHHWWWAKLLRKLNTNLALRDEKRKTGPCLAILLNLQWPSDLAITPQLLLGKKEKFFQWNEQNKTFDLCIGHFFLGCAMWASAMVI